jgi:hypothetical protein
MPIAALQSLQSTLRVYTITTEEFGSRGGGWLSPLLHRGTERLQLQPYSVWSS